MITAISILTGALLGAFFFGGLWLTVQRGVNVKSPALLFVASFFIRTAVVLIGFCFIIRTDWRNILLCLGGFLIARTVITKILRTKDHRQSFKGGDK